MGDRLAYRVALQGLRDRKVRRVPDLEAQERIQAGLGGEGGAQVAGTDGDGDGGHAVAVDDAGDLPRRAKAPARAGAQRAT